MANDWKSHLYRMVRSGSNIVAQALTSTDIPGDLRTHSRGQVHQTEEGRDGHWGAGGHATVPHEATDGEKEIQECSCPLY